MPYRITTISTPLKTIQKEKVKLFDITCTTFWPRRSSISFDSAHTYEKKGIYFWNQKCYALFSIDLQTEEFWKPWTFQSYDKFTLFSRSRFLESGKCVQRSILNNLNRVAKPPKTVQSNAGSNLESGTNHIWAASQISHAAQIL